MRILSRQNMKCKKTPGLYFFGIPAIKTCPMADTCARYCFATQSSYQYPRTQAAQNKRYQMTLREDFPDVMSRLIGKRPKIKFIRVHESGDYYSREYLNKWIEIAKRNPKILFYSYTKSVHLFKNARGEYTELPNNFKIVFSYGGKMDHMINEETDAHCKIFESMQQLKKCGYKSAMGNDVVAAREKKIGLVFHGVKKAKPEDLIGVQGGKRG